MCFRYLRIANAARPVMMPTAIDSSEKPGILIDGVVAFVDVFDELVMVEGTAGPPIMEMTPVDDAPFKVRLRLVPLTST
jgi:hypothetical protein